MARSECGRIVAVARYLPRGNTPGEVKENVLPLVRINPFDLPTFSKTREEANLNVQTALVAPEICAGVARYYATPLKEPPAPLKFSKMNGLYAPPSDPEERQARRSSLCPNGARLMQVCCGSPLGEAPSPAPPEDPAPPGVVRTEALRVLSPAALEGETRGRSRNPFPPLEPDASFPNVEIGLRTLSLSGARR